MGNSEKRIGRGAPVGTLRRRGGQPGNQNARKHGRSTAEAKAQRRALQDLLDAAGAHVGVVRALATASALATSPQRCDNGTAGC